MIHVGLKHSVYTELLIMILLMNILYAYITMQLHNCR